jgi:hypothetical protein
MKMLLTVLVPILGLLVPNSGSAADDKTFPVGVPVQMSAFFCFDSDSAKMVANKKQNLDDPEVKKLISDGKCGQGYGVATYVREIYRNGKWAVWELTASNVGVFYEATDWKPRKDKTSKT